MNAAAITLRQSHVASLYALGRMSPFEASLFGLGGALAGEAVHQPKNLTPNHLTTARPSGVRRVRADRHVGRIAGGDHGLSSRLVHDDHAQAQALQPPGQRLGEAPDHAATVTPAAALMASATGRLDLGAIAVGPADTVVQLLLCDAERLTATTEKSGNDFVALNDDRPNSHFDAPTCEATP